MDGSRRYRKILPKPSPECSITAVDSLAFKVEDVLRDILDDNPQLTENLPEKEPDETIADICKVLSSSSPRVQAPIIVREASTAGAAGHSASGMVATGNVNASKAGRGKVAAGKGRYSGKKQEQAANDNSVVAVSAGSSLILKKDPEGLAKTIQTEVKREISHSGEEEEAEIVKEKKTTKRVPIKGKGIYKIKNQEERFKKENEFFEQLRYFMENKKIDKGASPMIKRRIKRTSSVYEIESEKFFYWSYGKRKQVVLDLKRAQQLVESYHIDEITGSHKGQTATLSAISLNYYWFGVSEDIIDYIKSCEKCRGRMVSDLPDNLHCPIKVSRCLDVVGLDVFGPLHTSDRGNQFVLTLTDYFSKFVVAHCLKNYSEEEIVAGIKQFILSFGTPRRIVGDQDKEFLARLNTAEVEERKETHRVVLAATKLTPNNIAVCPYCGLEFEKRDYMVAHVIRKHKEFKIHMQPIQSIPSETNVNKQQEEEMSNGETFKTRLMRVVEDRKTSWDLYVHEIAYSCNTLREPDTNISPYYIMFGRDEHPRAITRIQPVEEAQITLPDLEDFDKYVQKKEAHLAENIENTITPRIKKRRENRLGQNAPKRCLCDLCGKSFKATSFLNQHVSVVHMGEKPYQCDVCDMSFITKLGLKVHKLSVHSTARRFKCGICGKRVVTLTLLRSHKRMYHTEKRYSCDYCNKPFAVKNKLLLHLRVHTGEKPYHCLYCEKVFTHSNNRKIHTRKMHKQEVLAAQQQQQQVPEQLHQPQQHQLHQHQLLQYQDELDESLANLPLT